MGEGERRQTKPRLTGLGASAAGVGASAQWENVETDAKVAQDVVTFLEDRRILFLPVNVEVVECSMGSVRELREFLTKSTAAHLAQQSLGAVPAAHARSVSRLYDANRLHGAS